MEEGQNYERYKNIVYVGEFFNGKKSGKIKEYFYDSNNYNNYDKNKFKLIFEGKYLKNCRLKGKEYYKNDKLFFEGEYLFKKKWNGKIYDYNGDVVSELNNGNGIIEDNKNNEKIRIFIGENLDKKMQSKNVKGIELDYNGRLLFKGEYLNGKKWKGKIKKYYKDELIFEGECFDGKIQSAKGKINCSGWYIIFEGKYINKEINGYIKIYNNRNI